MSGADTVVEFAYLGKKTKKNLFERHMNGL